jgi:uncharacterized membrane protein YeaQ/YmgE (transglycosylase-associated protein family)
VRGGWPNGAGILGLVVLFLFLLLLVFFVVFPIAGMALWALITTVVVGLIIGALGRLVVPGAQRIGFWATVLAGVCGSLLGGFIGSAVLHVAWLGTTLLQIGVAAAVVALMETHRPRQVIR